MGKIPLYTYFKKKFRILILLFSLITLLLFSTVIILSYIDEEKHRKTIFDIILKYSINKVVKKLSDIEFILKSNLENILIDFYKEYISYKDQNYINKKMKKYKHQIINLSSFPSIKISKKDINYYFINKKGIIFKTDYPIDLGLNLSDFSFWNHIIKLPPGVPYVGSIEREVFSGKIRLFSYIKLNDGNIFEIGVKFENLDEIIRYEFIKHNFGNFKILNIFIQGEIHNFEDILKKKKAPIIFNKEDKELLRKSRETYNVLSKKISLTKTKYLYSTDTMYGIRNVKIIISTYNLIYTIIYLTLTFIFIATNLFVSLIIVRKTTNNIAIKISNLANLFKQSTINEEFFKKLKNFKLSNIIEIDKIFYNYSILIENLISVQNKLINEKNKIKKLYIESEENIQLFKKLSEIIPAAIFIYKKQKLIFKNNYVKYLFNLNSDEIKINDIIKNIEDKQILNKIENELIKAENLTNYHSNEYSLKLKLSQNNYKWAKFIFFNVRIENEKALLLIFLDIDDLKKKEMEVIESYRQLDKYNKDILKLIEITNKIASAGDINTYDFLKLIFRSLFQIVDEADYGSVRISTEKYAKFVDAIGHDIEKLRNLNLKR